MLHSELEESFRTASEELATCRAELEKQKILTERLENDLMHVDRHMAGGSGAPLANGERPSGISTPNQSTDALSGLNLGSTPVRWDKRVVAVWLIEPRRSDQYGIHRSHSTLPRILQSFRSLQVSGIDSASVTPSLRRCALRDYFLPVY